MKKITDALAHKKQIILFLNKRGFFSSLTCRECGFTAKCPNCDVAVTYHKESAQRTYLLCHYCGSMQKTPTKCPQCSSQYIRFFGIGTQNIEEQIKDLFPKAKVERADRDTTKNKHSFRGIYERFRDGQIDVLVGTQIIAKGLDIENVALIGIVLADVGFHVPDFRASERVFQLLTQVSGRTGRLGSSGEVVIQTYMPDQPSIQCAATADYAKFYQYDIEQRKEYGYPPFGKLIKLIFTNIDAQKCLISAQTVYKHIQWLRDHKHELLDAVEQVFLAPPLIAKLHNKFTYHILLKGKDPRRVLDMLEDKRGFKVDVDPVSIG